MRADLLSRLLRPCMFSELVWPHRKLIVNILVYIVLPQVPQLAGVPFKEPADEFPGFSIQNAPDEPCLDPVLGHVW
jgi:hypothetical protein